MKKRALNTLVGLLYLSAALLSGLLHTHHTHAGPFGSDDCAACHWQLTAATDVPAPMIVAMSVVCEFSMPQPVIVTLATVLFPLTASRAPPVASA
jgi:hypothetical protein